MDTIRSSRPLEGVRVLDMSRLLPGPLCAVLFADLGASVDKLDDTRGSDYARVTPPVADDGLGVMFHWVNRGKRSIALDLKSDAGRAALLHMATTYDVVIEGNRPGTLDRLGVGYDAMRAVNPRIVYCAITGFGHDGPDAMRAGHDLNYIARAGVLGLTGPVGKPPQLAGAQIADVSGSLFGAIGVIAALYARERTGEGAFVDISMVESAMVLATHGLAEHAGGYQTAAGAGALTGGFALYNTYETSDGRYVSFAPLEPKFFQTFCAALSLKFPPSAMMPGSTQAHMREQIADIFRSRTWEEWRSFSEQHDCCVEVVRTPSEAMNDAHLRARGAWFERPTRKSSTIPTLRSPVANAADGAAPRAGEHTRVILREVGYDDGAIEAMIAQGTAIVAV